MIVISYIPGCTNEYQRVRISEHPLQIGSMVVVDQLETNGILRIFKPEEEEPLYFQYTDDNYFITGADFASQITVGFSIDENTVIIDNIYCTKGYEKLEEAMLEQVHYVADFYHFDKIRILDSAYQK